LQPIEGNFYDRSNALLAHPRDVMVPLESVPL
jgi:hypothetical protein